MDYIHTLLSWRRATMLRWMIFGAILISLFGSVAVAHGQGSTYYVAPGGSDGNPGTQSQPFQTIQHCAGVAQAGDTCIIAGGTYHETVTPTNSGTASAPITFEPASGQTVTIDGADPVTSSWSVSSGDVYQTTVQTNSNLFANQVFVDGVMMNEARWPNTGLDQLHPVRAIAEAGSNNGTLYDSHLTQPAGYWVGASIHLWGHDQYASQSGTVTASSPGQLSFSGYNGCPYLCINMYSKYYLSGLKTLLDSANEWYYDSSSHQLSLWTPSGDSPANHTVEIKQRNYAFDLSGRSYIHIQGFNLFASTITTDGNSNADVIDSITAQYLSHFSVVTNPDNSYFGFLDSHVGDTGIQLNGTNDVLSNSNIGFSAGNGVLLRGSNNTVTNNVIHDVDYMGTYAAGVNVYGNNQTITHNTIYRTGRDGITVDPQNATSPVFQNSSIAYNDIFNFSTLNRDSGAIYLCCQIDDTGTSIDHNLVHDSQVINQGITSDYNGVGIYPDNGTANLLIHHNVLWNDVSEAFHVNPQNGTSANNLFYNNTVGSGQYTSFGDCCSPNYTGTQIVNNIFSQGIPATQSNATLSNNIYTGTDPKFVNPGQNDYHLQSGSPAIDAGKAISGVTNGYVGSAPDIGAYEYGGTDWTAGSTLNSGILPVPSILDDSVSNGGINFNWGPVNGATGYKVYYGTTSGGYDTSVDVGNALSTTLTNLNPGIPYYFSVSAYNAQGETPLSAERWDVLSGGTRDPGTIYATSFDHASSGIVNDKEGIGGYNSGQWAEYDNVNFGTGTNSFTADISLDSTYAGDTLEVHLDSLTGPLIGSIATQSTGTGYLAWYMYTPQTTSITPTSGVHNVFLVATGPTADTAGNIATFHFSGGTGGGSTRDAYSTIQAESADQLSGDAQVGCSGSVCALGHLDGGSWAEYKSVDFAGGASGFTANIGVIDQYAGQKLELYLDSPTGTLIGTLTTQSTGDWNTFTQQSTTVSGASGVHDLYIVVPSGNFAVANLDWFTFTSSSQRSATSQIQAASYDSSHGDLQTSCSGTCIGSLDGGSWAEYKGVNFGSGVSKFTASVGVYTPQAGQKIELHLDSPTGTLIGTMTVQDTGWWTTFVSQSTTVSGASGVHDFYLVVPQGESGAANIQWFQFS